MMMLIIFLVFPQYILCVPFNGKHTAQNPYTGHRCETLRTDVSCHQSLNYNETFFPNHMGHNDQREAMEALNEYLPLINIECSSALHLFLCSLYFPVCATTIDGRPPIPLQPCKSLCLKSMQGCAPLMKKFSFKWPASMDCNLFDENKLCLHNPQNTKDKTTSDISAYNESSICPLPLKVPSVYNYKIVVNDDVLIKDCGMPCDQYFYKNESVKKFSRYWIGFWACMCTSSTLFTILTFLTNTSRLQYPERPIIYLSLCYFMLSIVYLIGFIVNDKIACTQPFKSPDQSKLFHDAMPSLVTQGSHIESCIITFIMGYFFWVASCVWFVILTFTWYLAAKLHWAHESIARNSQYFHFVAWTLPAVLTITALLWNNVEGDPLSGICFIGSTNPLSIKIFIIAPLASCLTLGGIFLMAGFFALFRIRKIVRNESFLKSDKLEKLIIRISMFSVLYIIPASVVIGCLIYETESRPKWMFSRMVKMCRRYRQYIPEQCSKHDQEVRSRGGFQKLEKPIFEVVMIKYLMFLIVGVTSGIWIWNMKTVKIWKELLMSPFYKQKSFSGSGTKDVVFTPVKYVMPSGGGPAVNMPVSPGSSVPSSSGVGLYPAPPPPSMTLGMCTSPDVCQTTLIDEDSGCKSYHGTIQSVHPIPPNNYNSAWSQSANGGLIPMASL